MWGNAQKDELDFWLLGQNNCINTFTEENKQLQIYAPRLKFTVDEWHRIDFENKVVLDVGSGPTSMLLRGKNLRNGFVVDPLMMKFPQWIRDRYDSANLNWLSSKGEDFKTPYVDMALIYNVLQHVENPKKLIENVKSLADEIRVFEWINVNTDEKHIHKLTAPKLNEWFGTKGITERIVMENSFTDAWYSVIKI